MRLRPILFLSFFSVLLFSPLLSAEKIRVYIMQSDSWEVRGAVAGGASWNSDGGNGAFAGTSSGGASPQTAEIIKTFSERCEECLVTMNKEKAVYCVMIQHEGGKGYARKDNKWAVFNRDGDLIGSGSTRTLGNAVKDACAAILRAEGRDSDQKTKKKPRDDEED